MCPLLTAHWCHLANAVKLVHSSARLSAQPKWQMDQLSCFCRAHGRKCLCCTMGAPIHQNGPFAWTPICHMIPLAHASQNPRSTLIGSAVFTQLTTECPYTLRWFAHFSSKLPLPMGDSGHHGSFRPQPKWQLSCLTCFAGLARVTVTGRQTDRPTATLVDR